MPRVPDPADHLPSGQVPSPARRGEDDGVLLSVVLDGNEGRSFLLVLDAATLGEVARARLPHHVPLGFHGHFYDV